MHLMFGARLVQIIGASVALILAVVSLLWSEWWYDYDSAKTYIGVASGILSLIIALFGGIGMFSYCRPGDVHWHLTLTLDWTVLVLSSGNVALSGVSACWAYDSYIAIYALWDVCTVAGLAAILIPIIRTHRQKKQGLVTARASPKGAWYWMEEQRYPVEEAYPSYPPSAIYPPSLPPTNRSTHVHRQTSRAISKADTTARWSGVSDTDTAAIPPTIRSETTVPAYTSSGYVSPRPYKI